ncbi:PAS domain S-box protein [bacterium]|nr:MAG: PAS domain S-box protein [bacterium]
MTRAPTFDDCFSVMSAASMGDTAARVALPDAPDLEDVATRLAIALNLLLDDLDQRNREQHRVEDQLRQAVNEQLHIFMNSVKDHAMITLDPDGNVASWNPGAQQIEGYRPDEIVGRHFSRFYADSEIQAGKPSRDLEEAARAGKFEDEGWRVRKDGSRFWANAVITALRDEDGRLRGFGNVTRDITERRRAEQDLTESHARLQAIIDTSLTAIVTMDGQGAITDWNPQAEATFGWPRHEALGKVLVDTIVPKQYREGHRAGLARYLATGEGPVLGKVLELSALDREGREFPVELAISPASTPGGKVLFVGFVRDITARKQAEDAIRDLNTELQAADQHKSEFMANMSHELRTPLNAILGFSELMLDDSSNQYDLATRQRFLQQINSSGRHLLGLINDILDLSKVEAGEMVFEVETVSIASAVAQVLNTIEPLATKKGIRIEARVGAGYQVRADAGKLQQMLLNLVSNAVKFTPEGGRVTIGARRLAEAVEISVADTGIGIAESDIRRLFKEFQQLDSSAGRRQEGTGLGLALTRRLAVLHGGDVGVVSELGKGSVFTLKLPAGAPDEPAGRD